MNHSKNYLEEQIIKRKKKEIIHIITVFPKYCMFKSAVFSEMLEMKKSCIFMIKHFVVNFLMVRSLQT